MLDINWFLAAALFFALCALAIAVPLLLSAGANGWN